MIDKRLRESKALAALTGYDDNGRHPTDHELVFTGAGSRQVSSAGKYVRILEATGDVYIKIDAISTELKRGKKSEIATPGFKKIMVRSAIAQTVRLVISDQPQDEGRDDVAVTTTASITPGNTFEGVADVPLTAATASKISNSDATQLGVIIKNPSSNTASVRIGGAASVGAAQGIEIEPGESIPIATTAEVWGYSAPGESVSVSVVREV